METRSPNCIEWRWRKITSFDNIKSVENEICEEADKKTQLIENHKRILISSLQSIKTHHERELDKVDSELTRAKTLLTKFKDSCDELLKTGSDVDICRENKSICRKTEDGRTGEHEGFEREFQEVRCNKRHLFYFQCDVWKVKTQKVFLVTLKLVISSHIS
jgi:hypothetical protein